MYGSTIVEIMGHPTCYFILLDYWLLLGNFQITGVNVLSHNIGTKQDTSIL